MKLTPICLLLVLSVSATRLEPFFLQGLAQGLSHRDFCTNHQERCGEVLGQLVSMLYHTSPSLHTFPNVTNLNNFLYGLANGLKTPNKTSNCYQDINHFLGDIVQIYSGFSSLTQDIDLRIVTDLACPINNLLQLSFQKDCKFQTLWNILESMTEANAQLYRVDVPY